MKNMNLVNLTPHALVLRTAAGEITVPPSGQQARVSVAETGAGEVQASDLAIPVVRNTYGEIEGLPAPQEDTAYLVSGVVLSRVRGRLDVFGPDTGKTAIRFADGPKKGQVEAVTRLVACDR